MADFTGKYIDIYKELTGKKLIIANNIKRIPVVMYSSLDGKYNTGSRDIFCLIESSDSDVMDEYPFSLKSEFVGDDKFLLFYELEHKKQDKNKIYFNSLNKYDNFPNQLIQFVKILQPLGGYRNLDELNSMTLNILDSEDSLDEYENLNFKAIELSVNIESYIKNIQQSEFFIIIDKNFISDIDIVIQGDPNSYVYYNIVLYVGPYNRPIVFGLSGEDEESQNYIVPILDNLKLSDLYFDMISKGKRENKYGKW